MYESWHHEPIRFCVEICEIFEVPSTAEYTVITFNLEYPSYIVELCACPLLIVASAGSPFPFQPVAFTHTFSHLLLNFHPYTGQFFTQT